MEKQEITTACTIIEEKKEIYDMSAQEIVTVDHIHKGVSGHKAFWKCYLMDFLLILGIVDNKQVDIFVYIVENTNPSNNQFVGTYKKIARDLGVSEPTIGKIMKKLQANNFIKKAQNGVWLVNPNIIMKGNDTKRQILLTYYNSDEPINQITYSRTKQQALQTEVEKKLKKEAAARLIDSQGEKEV